MNRTLALAAFALLSSSIARADELSPDAFYPTYGVYLELGPEHVAANVGGHDRNWNALLPRFGLYFDDPEPDLNFYGDIDMSLIAGSGFAFAGVAGPSSLFFPGADEERTLSYGASHYIRGHGGGAVDVYQGFRVGGNVDVDIGIMQAAGPGAQVDQIYGETYIGMGIGPTLAYTPFNRLRIYWSPNVSVMIGNATQLYTGYAIDAPVDVLFSVVPKFLDVKAQVNLEHRTFVDARYEDQRVKGGTFNVVSASVGVMGGLGWLFGF